MHGEQGGAINAFNSLLEVRNREKSASAHSQQFMSRNSARAYSFLRGPQGKEGAH